jgi:sensor histidine kinase YesM
VAIESLPDRIWIRVEDAGHGFGESGKGTQGLGVGLDNVRQRLMLCYGKMADLSIESSREGSVVSFFVPIEQSIPVPNPTITEPAAVTQAEQK